MFFIMNPENKNNMLLTFEVNKQISSTRCITNEEIWLSNETADQILMILISMAVSHIQCLLQSPALKFPDLHMFTLY